MLFYVGVTGWLLFAFIGGACFGYAVGGAAGKEVGRREMAAALGVPYITEDIDVDDEGDIDA